MQITAVPSAAQMVGLARILIGTEIPNPFGNAELPHEKERELQTQYVQRALDLLQRNVEQTTLFPLTEGHIV